MSPARVRPVTIDTVQAIWPVYALQVGWVLSTPPKGCTSDLKGERAVEILNKTSHRPYVTFCSISKMKKKGKWKFFLIIKSII